VNINVKDYIPFGSDNLFPQALALFSRTSPNHRGVINSKGFYSIGDGIMSEDSWLMDNFILKANYEGEMLEEVQSKVDHDEFTTGNGWFEIIRDKAGTFMWINHLDATKCRKAKDQPRVILHPDWSQDTGMNDKYRKTLPLYPNFESDGEGPFAVERCVYHRFKYEPEFVHYGLPQWISGRDAVQIDLKTNKWNLARLINAFKLSGIMFVPVKDPTESKKVLDNIKKDYTGEGNQDKLMVVTKSRADINEKADQVQLIQNKQEESGSWLGLHDMSIGDIVVAHSWYRALTGIVDNTGFDTQRILNEYNIALSTFIKPRQKSWVRLYQKLFRETLNKEIDLQYNNQPPVDTDDAKYVWEVRKEKGLEYDETDPNQQKMIYNGSIIDGSGSDQQRIYP